MGYEVRCYIQDWGDITVGMVDIWKCYDKSFLNLFSKTYDKGLCTLFGGHYIPDKYKKYYPNIDEIPDVVITDDMYGETLKYCEAPKMLTYLSRKTEFNNRWYYALLNLLLSFKEIDEKEFKNYKVVKFGS